MDNGTTPATSEFDKLLGLYAIAHTEQQRRIIIERILKLDLLVEFFQRYKDASDKLSKSDNA